MNIGHNLTAAAGAVLICAAISATLVATSNADVTSSGGVWQKHELMFEFIGFTSTYSCDGLAGKLEVLLKVSGARKDSKARAGACTSGFGRPDKFSRAHLIFYTLAPADGSAADSAVAAAWQPVVFTDHRPWEVDSGDCELVDQFQRTVLPMFTTRNVENHTTCVPHQISGSAIALKFESYVAAPPLKAR